MTPDTFVFLTPLFSRSSPQGHPRSIHPHYLSAQASKNAVLQETTLAEDAYTPLATHDTGPVASSYPGGIHTHLSSTHFQSARASDLLWRNWLSLERCCVDENKGVRSH